MFVILSHDLSEPDPYIKMYDISCSTLNLYL